jgi:3-hydroxyacyl-CoA dehydrogenase
MKTIAVIGAGMMGPGIAQVLAARGHPVQIHNRTLEKLNGVIERVRAILSRLADVALAEGQEIPTILERIHRRAILGSLVQARHNFRAKSFGHICFVSDHDFAVCACRGAANGFFI